MRKKILIITDNTHDQINGVVTTYHNLKLQAEKTQEYIIEFITPNNFLNFRFPGYSDIKVSIPFGLKRIISKINPDHIHIATEGPIGLAAKIFLDRKGIKYNTSYHTQFPEFFQKLYHIPLSVTYSYLRWFHKHSGKILVTTQSMKSILISHGFISEMVVWTRGVDESIFTPKLELKNNPKILLNVGRISEEKNLEAFCELDIYDTRKILVGDGPHKKKLMERYPNVEYISAKRGKELAEYFRNADVFVFPSKTDTFGIVNIESIACGTPVAAYPVQGPIDIIEQDVDGILDYDLTQAVYRCLQIKRESVIQSRKKWTWQNCWEIFKNNLIEK
jgi:glycosyltransferase involved in cell wall biosynthesis